VASNGAALRMNFVLYKTTVKHDLVLRHQALAHAKAAVVMQRRSELSGKACWINYQLDILTVPAWRSEKGRRER
jgi:hypothetical protein